MAVLILGAAGDAAQEKRLKEAAGIVAARAEQIAAVWGSKRIPASFRIEASTNVAVVSAGGPAAPQAWTWEQPSGPGDGYHPVFGHGPRDTWHWIRQDQRAFLAPAAEEEATAAAGTFANVIDDWARMLGFT